MTRRSFTAKRAAIRPASGLLRLVVVLAGFAMLGLPARAGETLRIGVLDYLGSEHSLDHWAPTQKALNAALPDQHFELEALDIHQLDAALASGGLDFVITNPGDYAELEFRYHISRIATADEDQPVASTLVAKGDFSTLKDLAGKRLAIVAPEAFGGFQLIWSEMADIDAGLINRVKLVVTGYPMQKAAEAVRDGTADAAVLRACLIEELQKQDPGRWGDLHPVLTLENTATPCAVSSAIYPGWPFAKTPRTSPELAKQVAVALMQMNEGNVWTVPLDYQPVHDLMRKLQIGPYIRTGPVSLSEFVSDYRDWLVALGIALVFWALYSVRIETLVRHRTRALNDANARLVEEMEERQRAEEADRLHRRELDHVARLSILGEMASSIAHELNQPLAAISNFAEGCLLRLRAGTFTERDMEHAAGEISGQASRAVTVIRRIRAFVTKRESQRAPVRLHELVKDCAALYDAPVHKAGGEVEVIVPDDLPTISGDKVQLTQVVLNLVQNAIDAMAGNSPETRRVTISAARHTDPASGPGICLSVRDRGHGMDRDALDHFAEAFYTTKQDGIGLGLALSRSIIEEHGGWMRAETPDDGQGLCVTMWLPQEGNP